MANAYTDIAEMSRYSQHLIASAASYEALDPFVTRLLQEQRGVSDQLSLILNARQGSTSTHKLSLQDQRTLSAEVASVLDEVYVSLQLAEKKGVSFDFTAFFPTRTRADIGRSIADRRAALTRCLNGMTLYPTLPDAADWTRRLQSLDEQFGSTTSTASGAGQKKLQDSKQFQSLRQQWRRSYLIAKRGMEAVLLLAGRENEYKGLFLDLQVSPANRSSESAAGTEETAASSSASISG